MNADELRALFKQMREEISLRMIDRIYLEDGTKNKWWMLFAKRKFMNKTL